MVFDGVLVEGMMCDDVLVREGYGDTSICNDTLRQNYSKLIDQISKGTVASRV